jgi:hypothetical protein
MAFNRKGMWTHIPVPAFIFVWRGAKPRTPKTENLVLHGCRNLRFSSASFSTLFAWYSYCHGEGLSREPYLDNLFIYFYLFIYLFGWLCRQVSVHCSYVIGTFGQVSVHDLNYWNCILKVEYSYMEIYLTSLIWFLFHVYGIQFPTDHSNDPVLF